MSRGRGVWVKTIGHGVGIRVEPKARGGRVRTVGESKVRVAGKKGARRWQWCIGGKSVGGE
jgi:hypothetical protein